MNNPEYILVDIFGQKDSSGELIGGIIFQVKQALGLPVLDCQWGLLSELKATLAQQELSDPTKKYPLIWIRQPFTINRGTNDKGQFGKVDGGLTLFIITQTNRERKAYKRMDEVFKPIIYPIYRQLLLEMNNHPAIMYEYDRNHSCTDRYYWGDSQAKEIDDIIDCMEISKLDITINNNLNNCQ